MNNGRIVVLVENRVDRRRLMAEHGLSFWIELGGRRILFDTGQGNVLVNNARHLGVSLDEVDGVVISHGHYDHTGGLSNVLSGSRVIPVFVHPDAFEPKFKRNADGTVSNVGIPSRAERRLRDKADLRWVKEPIEVFGGLHLTGPVPRNSDFEDVGGAFFKDEVCTEPDELVDDQAAFVDTASGIVVILGCAHSGTINTLRYIQSLTNNRPLRTVIGGTHLLSASPDRLDRTVSELRRLGVRRLFPCHCTGLAATVRLWNEFPGGCAACSVGTLVELSE